MLLGDNPVHKGYARESICATIQVTDFPPGFSSGFGRVVRAQHPYCRGRQSAGGYAQISGRGQSSLSRRRYRRGCGGAIAAAEEHEPDLVLLDLHLARGSTGFSVAVRLNDLGVACLFVSGKAPRFPMPDLAIGCLMKPFTAEDVHRSLGAAEDLLRGRETVRPKMPENLTLYEPQDESPASKWGSSLQSDRCGPGWSTGSPGTSIRR